MRALETGNLALALKWVATSGEAELREVFEKARAARDLGPTAGSSRTWSASTVPARALPSPGCSRFATVLERKDYDASDVDAGRAYIEAYVAFFKYAEGEDHEHGHAHAGHSH